MMRREGFRMACLATLVLTGPPMAARAELGRSTSTIVTDQQRMGARASSVAMGRYARHELTRPNGGTVREFSNARGDVFAVTWAGPGKPDLRTLLGRYFPAVQASGAAAGGRAMHSLRRPIQVSQADLQIQASGHMGWFRGVAFVPSLAPAGFSPSDLPQP